MTSEEKIEMLRSLTNEGDETLLRFYLELAKDIIIGRLYPFGVPETSTEVPPLYHVKQVHIASYLVLKRGAEGEIAHSENGVSRSYESGDVPPTLLRDILPFVSAVGTGGESI